MADDSNSNRLTNLSDRPAAGAKQSDPLAELARLIGQNDPFADFGRDTRATAATPAPPAQPRPLPNESVLAPPSYYDPREKYAAAPEPPPHQQAVPSFIQSAGPYRSPGYQAQGHLPQDHDFDLGETGGRRRKFLNKSALITLAVIGIAGAVGYRVLFGDSASSAPPKVIYSNPEPTKVPPPVVNADASTTKANNDRVGPQTERLATREEQPVDVNSLSRQGGRNQPPPQPPLPAGTPPSNQSGSAAMTAPSAVGEPKRVRTVTIRPSQTNTEMAQALVPPQGSASAAPQAPPAPPPPQAARPAPTTPSPLVQQRTAAAAPAPPSNAPLSLSDDNPPPAAAARRPAAPKPAPVQRPVAPPADSETRAPPPQSLAQAASPKGGGYVVQVSSQRSEAEAQAALRAAQAKYPNVLRGQQTTIRRADLGERGTFYRAMVGPFASRDQAMQVCSSLKAAGGDCIVPAN